MYIKYVKILFFLQSINLRLLYKKIFKQFLIKNNYCSNTQTTINSSKLLFTTINIFANSKKNKT